MSIARTSIIVTIFVILGVVLAFLSNMVIAMKFGARVDMDVFLAATTLPLFITSILSSSLSFTFIPIFAEYRMTDPTEGWTVVSSFINLSFVVTAGICIVGIVFSEQITRILVPGFTQSQVTQASALLSWLMPLIIFTAVNELVASVYYSDNRFVVPSLNKVISPIVTMIYVFLFHETLSTKSLALAMLTAAFLQTVILVVGFLKRQDYHFSFSINFKHPGVLKILNLMTPLVLGMIIYRAVPVFDRYFLSELPVGSISHIGYAMKLISALPTVIVSGISVSIFPIMARYASEGKVSEVKHLMSKGLRMLFFMSLPIAIFFGVFGKMLVKLLFERGAFTPSDTLAVYYAFAIYIIALPSMVIGTLLGQGYYILKDTVTTAVVGVGEMVFYVFLCYSLLQFLGFLAIPTALAAQFNIGAFLSALILRYKFRNKGGVTILLSMLRHTIAALVPITLIFVIFGVSMTESTIVLVFILVCFILYLLISRFVFATDEAISVCDKIMGMLRNIRSALSKH